MYQMKTNYDEGGSKEAQGALGGCGKALGLALHREHRRVINRAFLQELHTCVLVRCPRLLWVLGALGGCGPFRA